MAEPVRYTTMLEGLEVTMLLGIHPHEAVPQRVIVSVQLTVAYPDRIPDDRIDQVLDYDFVRDGVLRLAATRHFALQEVFCDAIAGLCLGEPRVEQVEVRTVKPDVYPDASIGCTIFRRQPIS